MKMALKFKATRQRLNHSYMLSVKDSVTKDAKEQSSDPTILGTWSLEVTHSDRHTLPRGILPLMSRHLDPTLNTKMLKSPSRRTLGSPLRSVGVNTRILQVLQCQTLAVLLCFSKET